MCHVIIYMDVVDVDNKLNKLCNARNLYVKSICIIRLTVRSNNGIFKNKSCFVTVTKISIGCFGLLSYSCVSIY